MLIHIMHGWAEGGVRERQKRWGIRGGSRFFHVLEVRLVVLAFRPFLNRVANTTCTAVRYVSCTVWAVEFAAMAQFQRCFFGNEHESSVDKITGTGGGMRRSSFCVGGLVVLARL